MNQNEKDRAGVNGAADQSNDKEILKTLLYIHHSLEGFRRESHWDNFFISIELGAILAAMAVIIERLPK